mgnify:CR=1 FL=1
MAKKITFEEEEKMSIVTWTRILQAGYQRNLAATNKEKGDGRDGKGKGRWEGGRKGGLVLNIDRIQLRKQIFDAEGLDNKDYDEKDIPLLLQEMRDGNAKKYKRKKKQSIVSLTW